MYTDDIFEAKIDKNAAEHPEPLGPGFPVAPPSSPQIPSHLPDIQIMLVGSPEFKLSPPLLQVEDFLIVPGRGPTARVRGRNKQKSRPSLRPLPTPPGPPPPHAPPAISCCPWANDPSPKPPKSQPKLPASDSNDDAIAAAIFYADIAPFLFASDPASPGHQGTDESQQQSSSDTSSTSTAYNGNASPPRGGVMTLSNTQAQEIRDVAEDTEFLDEIGLNTQAFKALLDGVDVQWDANQAGRD